MVAAATTALPVESKRGGGWQPGPDEVREILRSTRDLSGSNLRGMNLAGLDLRNASLANADLYLANLQSPPVPLWVLILFCVFL